MSALLVAALACVAAFLAGAGVGLLIAAAAIKDLRDRLRSWQKEADAP